MVCFIWKPFYQFSAPPFSLSRILPSTIVIVHSLFYLQTSLSGMFSTEYHFSCPLFPFPLIWGICYSIVFLYIPHKRWSFCIIPFPSNSTQYDTLHIPHYSTNSMTLFFVWLSNRTPCIHVMVSSLSQLGFFFQIFAIVDSATRNLGVQICFLHFLLRHWCIVLGVKFLGQIEA